MKAFKNHVRRRTTFADYGIFRDIHIPLLAFQPRALAQVKKHYNVTRVGFLVLSAGFTIQKNTYASAFESPQIKEILSGISAGIVFKALTRLLKQGLISVKEEKKSFRRFILTDKGRACIQSFVQSYNSSIFEYRWFFQPECLK